MKKKAVLSACLALVLGLTLAVVPLSATASDSAHDSGPEIIEDENPFLIRKAILTGPADPVLSTGQEIEIRIERPTENYGSPVSHLEGGLMTCGVEFVRSDGVGSDGKRYVLDVRDDVGGDRFVTLTYRVTAQPGERVVVGITNNYVGIPGTGYAAWRDDGMRYLWAGYVPSPTGECAPGIVYPSFECDAEWIPIWVVRPIGPISEMRSPIEFSGMQFVRGYQADDTMVWAHWEMTPWVEKDSWSMATLLFDATEAKEGDRISLELTNPVIFDDDEEIYACPGVRWDATVVSTKKDFIAGAWEYRAQFSSTSHKTQMSDPPYGDNIPPWRPERPVVPDPTPTPEPTPTPTPKPTSTPQPVATPTPVPSAAPTDALPAIDGMHGYFVYEARGHTIDARQARTQLEEWAHKQYGGRRSIDLRSAAGDSITAGLVCTGQKVVVSSGDSSKTYQVLVRGDASGTGQPGLNQLVRAVSCLRTPGSTDVLTQNACDLDGLSGVTLTDLILSAEYMHKPHVDGPILPNGPARVRAAGTMQPAKTDIVDRNAYTIESMPIWSKLYENEAGNLVRVECTEEGDSYGTVVIEEYDEDFDLLSLRKVPMELPLIGGLFTAKDYSYLIFGQINEEESDDTEVIRIVQYDKNWNRVASDSLRGANTFLPFSGGSLRCAEYGDMLYIRTCHLMYGGIHHQANMMIAVRQKNLEISDAVTDVSNISTGYVSHSFNQFVLVDDEERIVTLDHGDSRPRGLVVCRYGVPAGSSSLTMNNQWHPSVEASMVTAFDGEAGNNYTGASAGGFEELDGAYIAVYNQAPDLRANSPFAVYAALIDKETLEPTVKRISAEGIHSWTPQVVQDGENGGFVMWKQFPTRGSDAGEGTFCCVRYDAYGNFSEPTEIPEGALSNCKPIIWNGKAVWYVTENSAPTFYVLDENGLRTAPAI